MHRLQNFVIGEVIPELGAVERARRNGQMDELAMVRCFVAEKFLWLHLGAEVSAFPKSVSLAVYDSYLAPFFRGLVDPERVKEYAPHSRESRAMRDAFTPFAQNLFDRALHVFFDNEGTVEKDIFLARPVLFKRPERLIGLFQTHLLLRDHVWRSPAVRWFIRALNFSTKEFWNFIWKQDCSPEQVTEAHAEGAPEASKSLMYAGYLGMYRYGAQVKQLIESVQDDGILDSSDVAKLMSRIREIQGWTINLSSDQVSSRFEAVKQGLIDALLAQSKTDKNVDAKMVTEIEDYIIEALEFVGIPQPALVNARR
jgi:hypothetical protein